jgi:hypothetical protein
MKDKVDYTSKGVLGNQTELSLGSISRCTKMYAMALTNPWDLPEAPCIPDLITLPSYKVGFRARGVMQIGSEGVGWITANPYAFGQPKGSGDPQIPAGAFTDQTYGQNDYDPSAASGVIPYYNDSPFNSSDVGVNGYQYRPVGCGIKIRYTGTEITRAGRVICARQPVNTNFPPGYKAPDFLKIRETTTNPAERTWHYSSFRPALATDTAYNNTGIVSECLIVYVDGGTVGQSYEFDYIAWFEAIGQPLPQMTASHSDPNGMAATLQALPTHQPTGSPKQDHSNLLDNMLKVAKTAFSFLSPMVGGLISNVGGIENVLPALGAMFL